MSNEVTKPKAFALDNFGSFDESVEGDDNNKQYGSLLAGTRLKFTETARWITSTGEDVTDCVLLATDIRRTEVRWGAVEGKPPLEVRELQPGDKFRDLDAVNAQCPRSEWRMSFGKLKGPWERQYVVELADLVSATRYSWPTSTVGGGIAVRELVDSINLKRKLERRDVLWAKVKLTKRWMKTDWKGRDRPYLRITDWYPSKEEATQLPAPTEPQATLAPAAEQVPAPVSITEPQSAVEPSLASEMKDKVLF